jgi:MFS family permease
MSITAPEISPKDIKQVAPPGQHERPPRIDTPLKVVIASSFVLRVAGAATGLLLGTYLRQVVGAGTDLIGLLAAIFYVTELTLAPVFGALSDLRGRRPVLVLGPLAGAISVLVFPLSSVLVVLAVGRLLEGLSTAAKVPGALGYLADATSGSGQATANLRGRVMGLYEISFLVGVVAGNFMGGFLWEQVGTMGFVVVSITYLVATAMLFFFVPESLPVEARAHHHITRMSAQEASHPVLTLVASRLKSYADLVREPALRTFLPAWIAVNAVVGLWFTLLQPIMVQSPSHPPMGEQLLDGRLLPSQVGMVFAGFGLIFMVGIYVWSLFYGRLRKTDMMLASMAGMLLVIVTLFAINNNFLPGPWGQWPLVPLAAIGVLLQSGFTPVALAYLAEISGTRVEHRGAVMGLYSVFLGIGQLIGGAGGGFFLRALDWGFNGLIVATLILSAVAAAAVLYLRGKHGV